MGTTVKKLARASTFHHRKILGKDASRSSDLIGQAVGAYDADYKPDAIEPAPATLDEGAAYTARDRIRRRASRAQGRDSTIRTGASGAGAYTGAPARLLGG